MGAAVAERTLAERLQALRAAAGITQVELARRADLSLSLVAQLEQGQKTDPKLSTLRAIALALGAQVTDLVSDPPPPKSRRRKKEG